MSDVPIDRAGVAAMGAVHPFGFVLAVGLLVLATALPVRGQGTVDSVDPAPNALGVAPYATISVTFDGIGNVTTNNFSPDDLFVYGEQTGRCEVDADSIEYDSAAQTLSFRTICEFKQGEAVTVIIPDRLLASLDEPFAWQFMTRTDYGTGEFEPASGSSVAAEEAAKSVSFPADLYAGDIDGDSTLIPDLVHVDRAADELVVRTGNGDGTFTVDQRIDVGRATNAVGGDLEGTIKGGGRGAIDLVLNDAVGSTLKIVENNGSGGLTVADSITTGTRPVAVEVADLNRDGWLDIAVAAFGEDRVYVHLNDGNGNFPDTDDYAVGASPADLAARDVDNDGDLDLVVASLGDERIDYLKNDGDATFTDGGTQDLPFSPAVLDARDVLGNDGGTYGDGWVDLVVAAQDQSTVTVYQHDGNPATFDFTEEARLNTISPAADFVLADVDSSDSAAEAQGLGDDADLDLLSVHHSDERLYVHRNEANEDFAPPSSVPGGTGISPTGVVSADFDRDGDADVAVVDAEGKAVSVFLNTGDPPPPIKIEPSSLNCGTVCVDDDSSHTVTIHSNANRPVDVELDVDPDDGIFTPDETTFTIPPDDSVEVSITFAPGDPTNYAAILGVTAEEQTTVCGEPATERAMFDVPMNGTGGATVLSVTPDTIDFGTVVIGESEGGMFTATNDGTIEAPIDEITLPDDPPFAVAPTSVSTIAARSQQSFDVTFEPDQEGSFQDEVHIAVADMCDETDTLTVVLEGEAVPPLPDLDVPSLDATATLDDLPAGEQRTFEATIRNARYAIDTSFANRFELTRPDGSTETVGETTISNMGASDEETVQSDEVTFSEAGDYDLCVYADADDDIEEADENNNEACETISVRTPQPDLVAEELELADDEEESLNDVLTSQTRRFECRFTNDGDIPADEDFVTAIYRDTEHVGSTSFSGLAVGEQETFEATVAFPEARTVEVRCLVDVDEQIDEIDEDNNEIARTVTVDTKEELTVEPNPFTPNDDGFNDVVEFEVAEFGLTQPVLKIFSFEGQLIRTVDTVSGGRMRWDGRDDNEQEQPPGVYLYTVQEGGRTAASGHVTLAR